MTIHDVSRVVNSVETTSITGMPEAAENNKAAKAAVEYLLTLWGVPFRKDKIGNLEYYYLPTQDIHISVRFDTGKAQAAYSNFCFYDLALIDRGVFFLVAKGDNDRCLGLLKKVVDKCDKSSGGCHKVVVNDAEELLKSIRGFNV